MNAAEKKEFVEKMRSLLLAARFPELPEVPETGKWYRTQLEGCVNARGGSHYVSLKIGTEKKLVVLFQGGGVSWDPFTAARPLNLDNLYDEDRVAFYFDDADPGTDITVDSGIGCGAEENPFRNWSVISINYSTGDLHVGRNDYPYTSVDGRDAVLHHHGYRNYHASLDTAMKYIPQPEKLLIIGGSGGGFGVAALSDEVIQRFQDCKDVTCCVDSALLVRDWKPTAVDIWKAPEEICQNLCSNNYTLDCLKALHGKYGSSIKYLFTCAPRDGELARFQSFMDGYGAIFSKESGDRFQNYLREMVAELQSEIPEMGLFFFDKFLFEGTDPDDVLMQHTIIQNPNVFEKIKDGKSVMDWLWNAVNGKIEKIGLDVL